MKNSKKKRETLIKFSEWQAKAEDDCLAIEAMLKERGLPNPICFHAQQMAEKYLKGLLVFYDVHVPKVHDLLELETLLLSIAKDVSNLHDDLLVLTRYYITTRYPGDYPSFSMKDGREAYEAALRVKNFVLGKIG